MKSFVVACVAIVVISLTSSYALKSIGFSTQDQTTGAAVRVE